MADYLLHQSNDGTVLGVWFEDDSQYVDTQQGDRAKKYGQLVMDARGDGNEWSDYAQQLASKSPAPGAMWDMYAHFSDVLSEVLESAREDTGYDEDYDELDT